MLNKLPKQEFYKLFPKAPEDLYDILLVQLPKYEINTVYRVASFLAQCNVESAGFSVSKENLNYSAQGLLKTFPKYFDEKTAKIYERKPHEIANRVYANRMGNGDESTGDGWIYAGKGYIQLTGKDNYKQFGNAIGKKLPEVSVYLTTTEGAVCSALWYWKTRSLNIYADKNEITNQRKKINGGTHGLDEVIKMYNLLTVKLR